MRLEYLEGSWLSENCYKADNNANPVIRASSKQLADAPDALTAVVNCHTCCDSLSTPGHFAATLSRIALDSMHSRAKYSWAYCRS